MTNVTKNRRNDSSNRKSLTRKAPKQEIPSPDPNLFKGLAERGAPDDILHDDDVKKIDRLMLINASARYELLSANQQLIDFHLNRVIKSQARKVARQ